MALQSTNTNMDRVLSIPELLETILLHVNNRDLLTSAQRVSRYWHNMIKHSPQLQQKLFFRAMKPTANPIPKSTRNPLWETDLWPGLSLVTPKFQDRKFGLVEPLSNDEEMSTDDESDEETDEEAHDETHDETDDSSDEETPEEIKANLLLPKESTWRNMLLHQPPTGKIILVTYIRHFNFLWAEVVKYRRPGGADEQGIRVADLERGIANGKLTMDTNTPAVWGRIEDPDGIRRFWGITRSDVADFIRGLAGFDLVVLQSTWRGIDSVTGFLKLIGAEVVK